MIPAFLEFHSERFEGFAFSNLTGIYPGEVVFTTGMTGYPETLTDPSYSGQIVIFTYPIIGNYGVPPAEYWESQKIHAAGCVISDLCLNPSHYQSISTFQDWLDSQNIPLLMGVDTRAATKALRLKGATEGKIVVSEHPVRPPAAYRDLVKSVSTSQVKEIGTGFKKVLAIDCGMKENITRHLVQRGIQVKQVPYNHPLDQEEYDGVFISNGPGNPEDCDETIEQIKIAMEKGKPIFGICLGAQLMALAAKGKTYKLKFGHRGHNQPCLDTKSEKAYLTSQNHGYAVDEASLPQEWEVTFRNLNDGSIEGIRHKTKPFFAVQFHPEAAPGPHDTSFLFDEFQRML